MTHRGVFVLGGSPIGAAISAAFLQAGDSVYCVAREPPCSSTFTDFEQADCSNSAAAKRAVNSAVRYLKRLDVVVLAAASMPVASARDTTDEQWNRTLGDSLTSAFNVIRSSLPYLGPGGCIVAVGSTNSFLAAPALAAYTAAKAGLDGLMRQVAVDFGPLGIRANVVAPATIHDGEGGEVAAGYPLGRVGRPADVANAVLFLASSEADFITGVTLPVDGGLGIVSPAAFLSPNLRGRFPMSDSRARGGHP